MSGSTRRPYTDEDGSDEQFLGSENKKDVHRLERESEKLLTDCTRQLPEKDQRFVSRAFGFGTALLFLIFGLVKLLFFRSQSSINYPDLFNAELHELVMGLETGAFTSVDLTKAYIARITETNSKLHAVTEINPDALSIAATLDAERAKGTIRGPLHGIPMLIKNNIATNDKTNTTAGSHLLLGAKVPRDATVVTKLRAAGVIILGKANMSQWANFRSSNSSSGWSAHGGQVLGVYHKALDPSGSSSGSAVASSIGLAWATLGSETDGSIVCPAERNSIVGLKPTVGLTSRYLAIPVSEHQDTIGPMARTVSDAAYVLSAISGRDENDDYTWAQPWDTPPDYAKALNLYSLKGARIGVPRNALVAEKPSQPILDAFEAAIQTMKRAGAVIIEDANFSAWEEFSADYSADMGNGGIIVHADFISNIRDYFSKLSVNPQTLTNLSDVVKLTHSFPIEGYPERDTAIFDNALSLGFDNSDIRFSNAYKATAHFREEGGIPGALKRHTLDALILPSDFASGIAAGGGFPIITVPMGYFPRGSPTVKTKHWGLVESGPGVPIGLSFLGGKWCEEKLIGLAYAFEQRSKFREKGKSLYVPRSQLWDIIKSRDKQ